MIEIILRTLAFLGMFVLIMAYIAGLVWLGNVVLQPMLGIPLAVIVALGGGVVLPIAILFGVTSRD